MKYCILGLCLVLINIGLSQTLKFKIESDNSVILLADGVKIDSFSDNGVAEIFNEDYGFGDLYFTSETSANSISLIVEENKVIATKTFQSEGVYTQRWVRTYTNSNGAWSIVKCTGECDDLQTSGESAKAEIKAEDSWFIGSLTESMYLQIYEGEVTKKSYITFVVWIYGEKQSVSISVKKDIVQGNFGDHDIILSGMHVSKGEYLDKQYLGKFWKVYYSKENKGDAQNPYYINTVSRLELISDTSGILNNNYLTDKKIKTANFIDNEFVFENGERFNGFVEINHPLFIDKNGVSQKHLEGEFLNGKAVGVIKVGYTVGDRLYKQGNYGPLQGTSAQLDYTPQGILKNLKTFKSNSNFSILNVEYNFNENGQLVTESHFTDEGVMSKKFTFKNGYVVKEEMWYELSANPKRTKIHTNDNTVIRDCSYCIEHKFQEPESSVVKEYHNNGKLMTDNTMVNGHAEGKQSGYYDNGTPKYISYYSNGKLNGVKTNYHRNGKVSVKETFKDGVRVTGSSYYYNETGELLKNY